MSPKSDEGRRVVARFLDGRVLKGTTHDFAPDKPKFHLYLGGDESAKPVEVEVGALKAVFFVKSWEGDPRRIDDNSFDGAMGQGRRIVVTFVDDEVLAGYTIGYSSSRPGFFLSPADPAANNTRAFVVNGAVKKVEWVGASNPAFAAAPGSPARRA